MAFRQYNDSTDVKGLDLSANQGTISSAQMGVVMSSYSFIILRLRRNTSDDTAAATYYANIRANSATYPVGAYAFPIPYNVPSVQSHAETKAQDFITSLQNLFGANKFGDVFPVLDFEVNTNSLSSAELVSWLTYYKNYFESHCPRKLMMYSSSYFLETEAGITAGTNPMLNNPFWLAHYDRINGTNNPPASCAGFETKRWTIWQYTDGGVVNGTGNGTAITDVYSLANGNPKTFTADGSTYEFSLGGAPVSTTFIAARLDGVTKTAATNYADLGFNPANRASLDGDYGLDYNSGKVCFKVTPSNGVAVSIDTAYEAVDLDYGDTHIDYLLRPLPPATVNKASVNGKNQITWSASTSVDRQSYNIYRNGVKIQTGITGTSFTDTVGGQYTYAVTTSDLYEESVLSGSVTTDPITSGGANNMAKNPNATNVTDLSLKNANIYIDDGMGNDVVNAPVLMNSYNLVLADFQNGKVLIPAVASKQIVVEKVWFTPTASLAGGSLFKIQTTETSPAVVFSVPYTTATNGAKINSDGFPTSAVETNMRTALTKGYGVNLAADANFTTASGYLQIYYRLV